jgi:hypothetical protein
MATGNLSIPIQSAGVIHSAGGISITALRLWAKLRFARLAQDPLTSPCLLDTGAPLSVVPYAVHHFRSFSWQPLPGPWVPGLTNWLGVPCSVGRMDVWIPIAEAPYYRGPFSFIAKFALATPSNVPPNLPILLGLNFLADHRAETEFQCHALPQAGAILLP